VSAYGLLHHRHTPEIEQATGATSVLFTPLLVPMNRGIHATCTMRPTRPMTTEVALAVLRDAYAGEPFVVVDERSPGTKDVLGANTCHLTARVDPRTGLLLVLSVIDNLAKGTAGQAIQCANILAGLPETTGLPTAGLAP
jgi:N-acetyl-gamma-glutamyl-phosphate reductase